MTRCRVFLDYWNIEYELKKSDPHVINEQPVTVSGICATLAQFGFAVEEILVGAPLMVLNYGSLTHERTASAHVRKTRQRLKSLQAQCAFNKIVFTLLPPGGQWHGEIGVDAIIALAVISRTQPGSDVTNIVLSSDSDLTSLNPSHDCQLPISVGFFSRNQRRELRNQNRPYISLTHLEGALREGPPTWNIESEVSGLFTIQNGQRVASLGNSPRALEQTRAPKAGTHCIVDPFGLYQFAIRQLGWSRLPDRDTVERLLDTLGFPRPFATWWTVPNLQNHGIENKDLLRAWKLVDSERDDLHESLINDEDEFTQSQRADEQVSDQKKLDQYLVDWGHERVLSHRWMKRLTTGLINDLWCVLHSQEDAEVVVLAGNIELEHALRMFLVHGDQAIANHLNRVTYMFPEPPSLREAESTPQQRLPNGQIESFAIWQGITAQRGEPRYVTLPDEYLAPLVKVDEQYFGRQLRLLGESLNQLDTLESADPENAIDRDQGVLSAAALPQRINLRLNDQNINLLGLRSAQHQSDKPQKWTFAYSPSDDSLAPLVVPTDAHVWHRSKVGGQPLLAQVVKRIGRILHFTLPQKPSEILQMDVGDLPHRLSPDAQITVQRLGVYENRTQYALIDIPAQEKAVSQPPVFVEVVRKNPLTVVSLTDKTKSGILIRQYLPFDIKPRIGDRLLALETHKDGEQREFLALSSYLPKPSTPGADFDTAIVAYTHMPVLDAFGD